MDHQIYEYGIKKEEPSLKEEFNPFYTSILSDEEQILNNFPRNDDEEILSCSRFRSVGNKIVYESINSRRHKKRENSFTSNYTEGTKNFLMLRNHINTLKNLFEEVEKVKNSCLEIEEQLK